ncbi:metalloregulator ArsR/SmtB family transcription factor [Paenibacillus sp.]|uniref:ArsR/SmtB family transcription factor n=1 Tax=Paenibacillus sp. TaxID=58172 RepID=UPI002D228C21|nr:metalloregulator ArsR/SmtB family transcription factor [Paenibacillus sp.]HZG87917.1 metalloregulator ArsR/SmtB family transcription factor [Paenibacillus sp.]
MSDVCDVFCYDEEKVSRLKQELASYDTLGMTKIFKALADDTRAKIALMLCRTDELCVCDVANIIGTTIPNASHHLRLLRNLGLAKYRKEGKLVFYSLDDEHVKQLIWMALQHSMENKILV